MQRRLDYHATLVIAAALAGHALMQGGSLRTQVAAAASPRDELDLRGHVATQPLDPAAFSDPGTAAPQR